MKFKLKKFKKLKNILPGSLFLFNGTIGLKTEYRTKGKCDAYIVGSGEYFWGGTDNAIDRENLNVFEIELKPK